MKKSLWLPAVVVLSTCSSPTNPWNPGNPNAPDTTVAVLEITAPSSLLVNERALFEVTARTSAGLPVWVGSALEWTSSDTLVAEVDAAGVVTANSRGVARIAVRAKGVVSEVTVRVRARVQIEPDFGANFVGDSRYYRMGVGDLLQLTARYVDVDGVVIDPQPSIEWSSSRPMAVSVTEDGLVEALEPASIADIVASAADGTDTTSVTTHDVGTGSATIRIAHAALGLHPITFLPSKGDSVTLAFGESIERSVSTGAFYVQTEGFPDEQPYALSMSAFAALMRPGDHLSLFAVGDSTQAYLAGAWATPGSLPADSGRVRLIQGHSLPVVSIRSPDEPPGPIPDLCYFDPATVSTYVTRPAGDFDIVLQGKYGSTLLRRLRAEAPGGGSTTFVLVGGLRNESFGFLAFPDP